MNKQIGNKKIWIVGIIAVLSAVPVVLFAALFGDRPNYAQRASVPLEDVLVDAGAIKKCGYGDDGRGADSQRPWYDAFYELPLGREEAIDLVHKAASSNGYGLTHASKEDRGDLGSIADEHIDNWYFDNTKMSSNSELQLGSENIAFGVNNDGPHSISNISCGTDEAVTVNSGEDVTMITLSIKLPEFK